MLKHLASISGSSRAMRKLVSVYQRKGQLVLCPSNLTTEELWITGGPARRLDVDSAIHEKGAVVRQSLSDSRNGVPHPTQSGGMFDPVLKLAGVRSWKTFVNGTRLVAVTEEEGQITVVPTRNGGAREGFFDLGPKTVTLGSGATDEELGAAVDAALALAE